MKRTSRNQTHTVEYDSIGELLSDISARQPNQFFRDIPRHSEFTGRHHADWAGTASYEEAFNLLTTGWSPAAEELNKRLILATKAPTYSAKPRPAYDVVGGAASVPRYIQGIPTNMVRMKNTAAPTRIVTITKDIAYNAYYTSEEIMEEGVKVLRIVKTLEQQQHQNIKVKLNIFESIRDSGETLICKICVKPPEERINTLKVAFPMAHTSMLRRIIFRWIETLPEMTKRGFTSGYGTPVGHLTSPGKDEYCIPLKLGNVEDFVRKILK